MGATEGYLQGIDDYTVIKICTIGEKSVLIESLIRVSLTVSVQFLRESCLLHDHLTKVFETEHHKLS